MVVAGALVASAAKAGRERRAGMNEAVTTNGDVRPATPKKDGKAAACFKKANAKRLPKQELMRWFYERAGLLKLRNDSPGKKRGWNLVQGR